MAIGLSHNLLCFPSSLRHKHNNQIQRNNHDCFSYSLTLSFMSPTPPNPYSSSLRSVPKSSSGKNPGSVATDAESLPSPRDSSNDLPIVYRNQNPDSDPDSAPSISNSLSFTALLNRFREVLKLDRLGLEIVSIALPAALALAADPITSLVDTAFVGHLGSIELAAVGVSVSVFNLVSKLFNVPLLNVTTSFVAEEQALVTTNADKSDQTIGDPKLDQQRKLLLPSVSTSLALAAGLGTAEAIALSVGSGFLMNSMGIPVDSSMRMPAEQFLHMRAFGAPPIVIALAAQGTFRGFKDTKTPLYAVVSGNLLNAILTPLLIFFGLGIGGAAISTVISEYLIAFILLWKLSAKVSLITPNIDATRVARYLKSGGLLIARTLAVLITTTLATSMAAREGPMPMAGYQICLQVWLTVSLLTDALALAGQALLAGNYSQGDYGEAREVIYRVLQIGLITGLALAIILYVGFGAISGLFTSDAVVLEIARSGILFVAGSQPMNALAFVIDGLYYGVSDFKYAAYSMVLVGLISSLFLVAAASVFGLPGVWTGLFLFMTLRVLAGIWRLSTKNGPWKMVWSDMDQKNV